jgi:hypothetical protein
MTVVSAFPHFNKPRMAVILHAILEEAEECRLQLGVIRNQIVGISLLLRFTASVRLADFLGLCFVSHRITEHLIVARSMLIDPDSAKHVTADEAQPLACKIPELAFQELQRPCRTRARGT